MADYIAISVFTPASFGYTSNSQHRERGLSLNHSSKAGSRNYSTSLLLIRTFGKLIGLTRAFNIATARLYRVEA